MPVLTIVHLKEKGQQALLYVHNHALGITTGKHTYARFMVHYGPSDMTHFASLNKACIA